MADLREPVDYAPITKLMLAISPAIRELRKDMARTQYPDERRLLESALHHLRELKQDLEGVYE